jgi:hypothetical protein
MIELLGTTKNERSEVVSYITFPCCRTWSQVTVALFAAALFEESNHSPLLSISSLCVGTYSVPRKRVLSMRWERISLNITR